MTMNVKAYSVVSCLLLKDYQRIYSYKIYTCIYIYIYGEYAFYLRVRGTNRTQNKLRYMNKCSSHINLNSDLDS